MTNFTRLFTFIIILMLVSSCGTPSRATPAAVTATATPVPPPTATGTPRPIVSTLSISPGTQEKGEFLSLDSGGDVDTEIVSAGDPASPARRTGNGQALASADGNRTPDSYMQFNVDRAALFAGQPTTSVKLEIVYFDEGTDTFLVQYDATSGGPFGNGKFSGNQLVVKTDTKRFKTAAFILKDVYFGDRDNGADLRISDQLDGAETIQSLSLKLLPVPTVINVDACGADPYDDRPDSDAIQACIDQAREGDTVTFTSGENTSRYQGYLIDKTIFLEKVAARRALTFTSTDPANPALLKAAADLKGFVVRLYARSRINNPGEIDFITISHLHLDGNRDARVCLGPDGVINGVGDNWGSWLPECTEAGDPWCSPGTLDLAGAVDWGDSSQRYTTQPDLWSTGLVADDLHITNTECGTAFGMAGAANVITNTTIETAGDHVHAAGCAETDPDNEGVGDWSDGITLFGPGHLLFGNTIVNASDVGIVFFGGRETVIRNNTIRTTPGNHGTFAGIAIHPWSLGDIAYGQVIGNTVINEGNQTCGGIHAGINLGPHMWGGGCDHNNASAVGNATCSLEPAQPNGTLCPPNATCQKWAYIPAGTTYLLANNSVTGAHLNYLVEGLDQVGALIDTGNLSSTPRWSDWGAARTGCNGVFWGPTDRVAHHPSLPGWTDLRVHCER